MKLTRRRRDEDGNQGQEVTLRRESLNGSTPTRLHEQLVNTCEGGDTGKRTYNKDHLVVSCSGPCRDIGLILPDARVVGHTKPANVVANGIDERTSGGAVSSRGGEPVVRDQLLKESSIAVLCIPGIVRVDIELMREKRVVCENINQRSAVIK